MMLSRASVVKFWLEGSEMVKKMDGKLSLAVSIEEAEGHFIMYPDYFVYSTKFGDRELTIYEPERSAYSMPVDITREYTY